MDLSRELKNLWNTRVTLTPIVVEALGTVLKGSGRGLEELETRRRRENLRSASILCPKDMKRLALAQTPVKDHQQTLEQKEKKMAKS